MIVRGCLVVFVFCVLRELFLRSGGLNLEKSVDRILS